MSESEDMVKPGWKTTEFWLSAIAALVGLIAASGIVPDGGLGARIFGAIVTALAALGYNVSRGLTKGYASLARSLQKPGRG